MSKLFAKQFYIEQIKKDNVSHRRIANRMSHKFDVSPAVIRDELLKDGYIKISSTVLIKNTQKRNYYFELTDKSMKYDVSPVVEKVAFWEDGTPKSKGNAFDLSTAKGLFNKTELANLTNKGRPNNYNAQVQVIAYSRA